MRALVVVSALVVGLAFAAGCGPEVRTYERDGFSIHAFLVGISNVYAVEMRDGTGLALVDLGTKDTADAIVTCLDKIGKKPSDVTVAVVSHGHFDHAGTGAAMLKTLDAPIALGADDVAQVESGVSDPHPALILEGVVARPFLDVHFPAWTPDVTLRGGERLDQFGVPAQVVAAPGHTPGSMAFVLDSGDAFIGDLARGVDEGSVHPSDGSDDGHVGRASTHLFSEDVHADAAHLGQILGLGARTFFPGHGPMFLEASLRGWVTDTLNHD